VYYNEKIQTQQLPFGRGDSHMPVGWGSVPFSNLFAQFIHGFQGLLICELHSRYFERTGEAAANLAAILREMVVKTKTAKAEISSISDANRTDS
ncbi:MAG TPA: hypothetical protein VLR45_08365, partial [Desulfoprunum sp.]|nr:hypothetical protein [Desulfoprunum sp.]